MRIYILGEAIVDVVTIGNISADTIWRNIDFREAVTVGQQYLPCFRNGFPPPENFAFMSYRFKPAMKVIKIFQDGS